MIFPVACTVLDAYTDALLEVAYTLSRPMSVGFTLNVVPLSVRLWPAVYVVLVSVSMSAAQENVPSAEAVSFSVGLQVSEVILSPPVPVMFPDVWSVEDALMTPEALSPAMVESPPTVKVPARFVLPETCAVVDALREFPNMFA